MATVHPSAIIWLAAAFAAPANAADLFFVERSIASGLTGAHLAPGGFGLQFMAGGAAAGDFDRDGDQDIFLVGGSAGVDQLFINQGDGTFTDQAEAWGVAAAGQRHTGVAVADYDSDGWLDILVTCIAEGDSKVPAENRLYRNNADGSFTDVADTAGVRFTPRGTSDSFSGAFGDYDKDGASTSSSRAGTAATTSTPTTGTGPSWPCPTRSSGAMSSTSSRAIRRGSTTSTTTRGPTFSSPATSSRAAST
jgi:hypothetical protein